MNKKGFYVKIFNLEYFLFFEENGLYLKSKNKKSDDLFIPYEQIAYWDAICLDDSFFFKMKYKTLFKIYIILGILFFILSHNLILFGIFLFFFIIVSIMFYFKINYLLIIADYEKILIKVEDNKKVCYFLRTLNEKCNKLSLKERVIFNIKYELNKIKQIKE